MRPVKKNEPPRKRFTRHQTCASALESPVMIFSRSLRRWIQGLGPYSSLALLSIPVAIVEPLKLSAVFIFGEGHRLTGIIVVACAYAVSLLLVEQLFKLVKPKLLTLVWFSKLWSIFLFARRRILRWGRAILNSALSTQVNRKTKEN